MPVVILSQCHFLKVNVQPMALRGLQYPVTRQIVAVVSRKPRRDDTTLSGISHRPPTSN